MSNRKISFAKIIADQHAKKTVREVDKTPSDSSPEKETIEGDKFARHKVQENRILAPKLKPEEQATSTVIAYPASTKVKSPSQTTALENEYRGKHQEVERNFPRRRARFEERFKRVTTYLENDVYEKVQELYESGEIDRINNLVNTAVKLHLRKFYGLEVKNRNIPCQSKSTERTNQQPYTQ
ncbi:hypothetical protein ACTID9_28290 [Brevibacillus fluminis]|uniref:hypothetical protein n=1 Tax=Brevibacillus fluminis TaxID=511487 RepID=UPI003F8B6F69